ncbi:hypothetical protein GTG28_12735 [Vibrio sp. OCN044]|uniref:Uncharacterized protein n=1 Tax=Vibrio tetraodonis subsp. pristinus TaxID=2695891 RepID=A0A6L8M393_9VIBR|nr:hypothetical protein [Vibrio tetraodonis]MYM60092.1 hypothetical protein [Vibrio tetraodonis subsp. pristinus]
MWLIEFVDGHLNGICLPFDDSFSLTGNKDAQAKDLLSVPEYFPSNTELNFEVKDKKVQVSGLSRGKKIKQLKENRIYRFRGLGFFVYQEGSRRPNLRRYRFRQYKPLIAFSLVINIAAAFALYLGFINYQHSQVAKYIDVIESGYIKDGELIVFDKSAVASLPEFLQKNIRLVESNDYFRTSRLDIDLVSEYSGKSIAGRLVSKADRDEIVINTYERDNHIMALFGDYGLSFSKQDDYWLVSDRAKASQILKSAGLSSVIAQLKSRRDETQIITSSEFPYSIFYSTKSGGYIYDQQGRYWEGSTVPRLGVIQSITRDKVVFKDGQQTRVYLIQP